MEFRIRDFRENDSSKLVYFKKDSVELGFGRDLDTGLFSEFLLRQSRKHPGSIKVAEDEKGNIAGYVIATLRKNLSGNMAGRIHSIYVVSGVRKEGLGSMLLESAEDYLRSKGAVHINANISNTNDASMSLLRKFGYDEKKVVLEKQLAGNNIKTKPNNIRSRPRSSAG